MPRYTDEQIIEAAIERYLEQHPGASREEAELIVERVLSTMSRTQAIALYIDRVEPEDVPEDRSGPDSLPVATPQSAPSVPTGNEDRADTESRFTAALQAAGVSTTPPDQVIGREEFTNLLERYGADMEAPEIAGVTIAFPSMTMEQADGLAQALARQHPDASQTAYANVLQESGFDTFPQMVSPSEERVRGGIIAEGYTRNPETGWLAYEGGVLANPDTGDVTWDPNSTAPGTSLWLKEVRETWTEEQVLEWRKQLHQFGYLAKEQTKAGVVDAVFLQQLQAYHLDRYANFGKAVPIDLTGGGTAGSRTPLVDFEDFQAQTRNAVREEYRRVFGEDPTDGEVEAFTSFIVKTGMELQKKYRRKGYSSPFNMAATEVEERFISQLEQSPEAQLLRDSEEENTSLRDAMQQSVIVANSLAG